MRWFAAVLLTCALLAPLKAEALPQSTDAMIKHLQSMGYTCTKDNSEAGIVIAEHPDHLNFIFYEGGNGIAFSVLFNLEPEYKDNPMPVLRKFNELMENDIWLPQLYMYQASDQTLKLRMQAWMPDTYNREAFSNFMARWQEDTMGAGNTLKDFFAAE